MDAVPSFDEWTNSYRALHMTPVRDRSHRRELETSIQTHVLKLPNVLKQLATEAERLGIDSTPVWRVVGDPLGLHERQAEFDAHMDEVWNVARRITTKVGYQSEQQDVVRKWYGKANELLNLIADCVRWRWDSAPVKQSLAGDAGDELAQSANENLDIRRRFILDLVSEIGKRKCDIHTEFERIRPQLEDAYFDLRKLELDGLPDSYFACASLVELASKVQLWGRELVSIQSTRWLNCGENSEWQDRERWLNRTVEKLGDRLLLEKSRILRDLKDHSDNFSALVDMRTAEDSPRVALEAACVNSWLDIPNADGRGSRRIELDRLQRNAILAWIGRGYDSNIPDVSGSPRLQELVNNAYGDVPKAVKPIVYKWPAALSEDIWIYENIHHFELEDLQVEHSEWCQRNRKNGITFGRNTYKNRADRYANFHGLVRRRFKGGCKCDECKGVTDT